MSTGVKKELARGAIVSFLSNGGGKAVVFLGHIFLARWLGIEDFGIFNLAVAITAFLVILSSAGLQFLLLRFVSAYASEERWTDVRLLIKRCTKIVLVNATIVMTIAATVVLFLDLDPKTRSTLLVSFLLIPLLCLSGQRQQTLRALKHLIAYRVAENIVVYVALMLIGAWIWHLGMTSSEVGMGVRFIAEIIALMVGTWLLQRALRPHADKTNEPEPSMSLKALFTISLPLMVAYFADRIVGLVDVAFLGILSTPEQTGLYTAAARIALISSMGQNAVNAIAAPLISASHRKGDAAVIKRILIWSCIGSGVFGLCVFFGINLFSDFVLGLFGNDFRQAADILFILLLGQLISSVFGPIDFILSMTGRQKELSFVVTIGAVATLTLCPLLIPLYGAIGAAIATTIAIAIWKLSAFAMVWFRILR